MADLSTKKYIDEEALKALIKNIKTADAATLTSAKNYVGTVPEDFDDALAYVESLIDGANESGAVSIDEVSTGLADSVLKSYVFYQGLTGDETAEQKEAKKIGTINLAKDLVVTAGEVVKVAADEIDGLAAGTYLKLTIANQTAPVYINVLDLVNDFTVEQNAASVQLAISDTREISASIKDGSIARAKIDKDFEDAIKALEDAIGEDGAVADQIAAALEELALTEVGGTGKIITTISQADGQVSATAIDITDITGDLSKAGAEGTDPTPRTVKEYVDDSIDALAGTYVAITESEVNTLFTTTTI